MHPVQDIILAVSSLLFSVALIPSMIGPHKPAITTSLLTAMVLFVIAGTYISLSLWFSAVTISINGICWLVLVLQKFKTARR